MTTTSKAHAVVFHTRDFRRGLQAGLSGQDRRYDMCGPCQEATLVEMVRSIAERYKDDELSWEVLLQECGIICGYVISTTS